MKILAHNKRGRFDYDITETLIAGIELLGPEVKSIKAAHISLKGSFVSIRGGQAYLTNAHVSPYIHSGNTVGYEPLRSRKLLMHRKELDKLQAYKTDGKSIVPLCIGLERNLIKVELGIGRGKKLYDKRESIKARELKRNLARKITD